MKKIPGTVFALGLVSFFSDFASEMIYPLLPLFLATILGAGRARSWRSAGKRFVRMEVYLTFNRWRFQPNEKTRQGEYPWRVLNL